MINATISVNYQDIEVEIDPSNLVISNESLNEIITNESMAMSETEIAELVESAGYEKSLDEFDNYEIQDKFMESAITMSSTEKRDIIIELLNRNNASLGWEFMDKIDGFINEHTR